MPHTGPMRLPWNRADAARFNREHQRLRFSGFAEPVPDLYEFRTSDGHYIFLHEMACVSIQFSPVSRDLGLTFECVASDLMDHPLTATLTFGDAEITQWVDDVADPSMFNSSGKPTRLRGQVGGLWQGLSGKRCKWLQCP